MLGFEIEINAPDHYGTYTYAKSGKKIPKYYSFLPETHSHGVDDTEFLKFPEKRSIFLL